MNIPQLITTLELLHANAAESPEWLRQRLDTALALAREPLTVWTLTISHRHGEDVTVYASEELARADLYAYVAEWWDREKRGEERDQPLPTDPEDAITRYFAMVDEESADIECRGVETEPVKIAT